MNGSEDERLPGRDSPRRTIAGLALTALGRDQEIVI